MLDVIARHEGSYRPFALTAHRSVAKLLQLSRIHRPRYAVLSGACVEADTRREFGRVGTELLCGPQCLRDVVANPECDVVVAAIVGSAGLAPTLAAVRAGKKILLANKEALVMAGQVVIAAARQSGAALLPIDSEHSGVFQCLGPARVSRIVLTASGGPFLRTPLERLRHATPEEACAHPTWSMGRKISVDSATMMNKALEVVEANWLFGMAPERIDVLIHPQSIVHALVEYVDGSVVAQMACPDMRVPIAAALAHPDRIESGAGHLDLASVGKLAFENPDPDRFPALRLGYQALARGGTAPAILNAANEIAVEAFLARKLRFPEIAAVVERTLYSVSPVPGSSLEEVLEADAEARERARLEVRKASSDAPAIAS